MPGLKWPHLRRPREVGAMVEAQVRRWVPVVNSGSYAGERAEAVVLMAYLAKFGDWPLTAQALMEERPSGPAGRLPPIDPATGRVY